MVPVLLTLLLTVLLTITKEVKSASLLQTQRIRCGAQTDEKTPGKILNCLQRRQEEITPLTRIVAKSPLVEFHLVNKKLLEWLPDGFKNGLASGLAAAVVKTILQPFDTIKTVQQAKESLKMGPIVAGSQIIKQRGIGGLWSGIGVTVIGSSPSVAVYFGVYSSCKSRLTTLFSPRFRLLAVALSAMFGNTIASFLRVPYEVIKQRIQAGQFSSTMEAVAYSWHNEGLVGLFGGGKLSSQILRDVPYAIVTLVSYEILQEVLTQMSQRALLVAKDEIKKRDGKGNEDGIRNRRGSEGKGSGIDTCIESRKLSSPVSMGFLGNKKFKDAFCGSLAGGLGTLATTPMDVVKTRMMTGTRYSSIFDATMKIASEEGFTTFFIGTVPRLLHKIPANGLFFLCYETFRSLLGVVAEIR